MIQSVFKPSRRKSGKRIVQRLYVGRYRLHEAAPIVQVPLGTSDKQVAVSKLADIVRRKQQEEAGLIPSETELKVAAAPLTEHLKEFISERGVSCRSMRYVREMELRLKRLFSECAWKRASDINAGSFLVWRGRQILSAKSLNEFLVAARGFNRWLRLRKKVLQDDPLESVDAVSTIGRETFKRRPLSKDEIDRLLANSGPRWVIYLTAIYTGLRRGELKQLQWQDVFLDGETPRVILRAETTKNGKSANLPLHPDACRALKRFREEYGGKPCQRIFEGVFPKIPTFHKDLQRAGIDRLRPDGAKVDFHSFRYTYCNLFPATGAAPGLVKEAMRHSDLRLTLNTYTASELLPLRETINALPSFYPKAYSQIDSQRSGGSGPDLSAVVATSEISHVPETLMNKGSGRDLSQTVADSREDENGARYRVRTCDPYRVKVVLYR